MATPTSPSERDARFAAAYNDPHSLHIARCAALAAPPIRTHLDAVAHAFRDLPDGYLKAAELIDGYTRDPASRYLATLTTLPTPARDQVAAALGAAAAENLVLSANIVAHAANLKTIAGDPTVVSRLTLSNCHLWDQDPNPPRPRVVATLSAIQLSAQPRQSLHRRRRTR